MTSIPVDCSEPKYVAGHVQGAVSRIMQRKRGEVAEIARSSSCAMDKELDKATLMFTVEVSEEDRAWRRRT
jgi:hypothetical protein